MRTVVAMLTAILLAAGLWMLYMHRSEHASIPVAQRNEIAEYAATVPLREQIEGLLILHTPGTDPAAFRAYLNRYHPAGLILMGDNIPVATAALHAKTEAMQASTTYPYLIATDEEGCTVKRLSSDTFACPRALGAEPVASTSAAFLGRSELLKSLGINLNFGIVADVTNNPESFIFPRVFGADPTAVAERVRAAVIGTRGETLSTLKHFPGHGETLRDSHASIPRIDISYDSWTARDAAPFQAGIAAGADLVMFGHLEYVAIDSAPASLSSRWHQILADTGFHGLSITDDMLMLQHSGNTAYANPIDNAVAALQAGNDLLLYVNDHDTGSSLDVDALVDGIVAAVKDGRLSSEQIREKFERVLAVRATLR